MKDIKAKILSNKNIRAGYYKIALEAPYIAGHAKPGQFIQVRCNDGTEPLLRRPFSVHRVSGKTFEILYEIIGKGTEILSKKRNGEILDILGPLGNGFTLSTVNRKPSTVLIAGGIGVAPLLFLAEELVKKKIRPVVLIGAKAKNLVLCEKDFKKLGAEVHIATDDGTHGRKGFVSELFNRKLSTVDRQLSTIYSCGPNPMLKCIAGICKEHKLECEVSLEEVMACGIGACLGCVVKIKGNGQKLVCKDGPVFNASEVIWK